MRVSIERYGIAELEKDFGSLTFGNALASYRIGEEKSQREFAAFLSISPQSLCDIEIEELGYGGYQLYPQWRTRHWYPQKCASR